MTVFFESVAAWREKQRALSRENLTMGFVPTMGALHDGHLSLVRRSQIENDHTLVSIFVNPTQFDDARDLARYPRTFDADSHLLSGAGVDFVLVPPAADLYPDDYRYRVCETERSKVLEGAYRFGHFEGVLTVVLKLLQIASADRAYFGEKDWQQLELVRGMAQAFFLPTAIVGCPTVRDVDGLALSSRNRNLSAADRHRAPGFHRALVSASTPEDARRQLRHAGFTVDYVEDWEGRRLGAVRLGGTRLIDNVPVDSHP
jgi:pantoate--beta-alanine ligase